jgi:hypothetical protein
MEEVVLGLVRVSKPAHTSSLAKLFEAISAAREDLMRVALVADVPDEAIPPEVIDRVQRRRELNDTDVRAQVPAGLLDGLQQESPHLLADEG